MSAIVKHFFSRFSVFSSNFFHLSPTQNMTIFCSLPTFGDKCAGCSVIVFVFLDLSNLHKPIPFHLGSVCFKVGRMSTKEDLKVKVNNPSYKYNGVGENLSFYCIVLRCFP